MIVAAVVSLLLQVISFFTTLDGAKAYFEATFALAPLFFALAVQSVVYFLENSLRSKPTLGKVTALAAAVVCSSYFSFVGIYSNINPPERYLEQTYNSYAKQLAAASEELLRQESGSAAAEVNKAVNLIIREYTALVSEQETLKALSEELSQTTAESASGMTAPRRYDYYSYEDYAAAYSAYIASLSQNRNEEQRAQTRALLEKYGLEDTAQLNARIAENAARISLIEGTVGASDSGFYEKAEQIRAEIMAGDGELATRIFTLYGELSGGEAEVPAGLGEEPEELSLPEYAEIAGGAPAAVVRERLTSAVSAACDTLNAQGAGLNPEEFAFESVYTLPVYAVTKHFGTDAAVSLLLAVLVDLLSLLFAMIFSREKSILSAQSTKRAADMRSDLFERNIMTALQLGVCAEGGSFSGSWSYSELTERLAGYVGRFRASGIAQERGFSLLAERALLGEYEALTAFLCQFGLAGTLSAEDASVMTGGEITVPCVLLKTKFLLWVSEKFCSPEQITDDSAVTEEVSAV